MQAATNSAAGISLVAFVVAVVCSLAYYQTAYVPEVNTKPVFPKAILEPEESIEINIAEGASLESSKRAYVPNISRGVYGVSNRVTWTNTDSVRHTVTSDTGYIDVISGKFDSTEQFGQLIGEGETFTFTFTKVGEYLFHCEPHPHMQGKVEIVENYARMKPPALSGRE